MIVSAFDSRLGPNFLLHPGFICAGGEEGKDACKGNSLYSLSLHHTPDQVTGAAPWCVTWAGCGNLRGLSAGAWAAARGTCPGSMSGQWSAAR